MRSTFIIPTAVAACTVAWLAGSAQAEDDMLAVAWAGNSYTIDSSNGIGSLLGNSGFTALNALCTDGTTFYSASASNLVEVDPITGIATLVGTVSINSLRGMAMERGGDVIYAYNDAGGPDSLYTIDPNIAVATRIGPASHGAVQGLAFDANGQLWAWDIAAGLLTVDKSTGATTAVGGPGNVDIQCLAFGPEGTLYGARHALFTIDTSNGNFVAVGSGGYSDLRGIEFLETTPCLELTVNALTAGETGVWTIDGADPASLNAVVFGFTLGESILNGQFGFCSTFGINGINGPSDVVGTAVANGAGQAVVQRAIPGNASGVTVHTQASQQGTCPSECMSEVDTQTIQ